MNAFAGQLVGDFMDGYSDVGERRHRVCGGHLVFGQACPRPAVIAKGVKRGRRNRIYRIRPDQLLDVDNITITGVFCAGAGPEQALRLRTSGGQGLPSRPAEELLIALVVSLALAIAIFPVNPLNTLLSLAFVTACQPRFNEGIDRVSIRLIKKLATLATFPIATACRIAPSRLM